MIIFMTNNTDMLDELDKILEELNAPPRKGEKVCYVNEDNIERSRLSYSKWQERGYQVMKGERSVKRLSGGIYLFDFSQVKPIGRCYE